MATPKKATGGATKKAAAKKKAPAKKAAPRKKAPASEPKQDEVDVGPAPITPSSTPGPNHQRVLYENMVNDGAERFAAVARSMYIEATLAGKTVEIVVSDSD